MQQKLILLFILVSLVSFKSVAQDVLISINGTRDTVIIVEITPELIKFNKAEHPGILYSKTKKELDIIQYADGKKEDVIGSAKQQQVVAHLTDKGNKVFILSEGTVERLTEKYLADHINMWSYWKVVTDISDADFILDLNLINKRGVRGFIMLKSRDGLEISHSKSFKGYGPGDDHKGFADVIMREYLKKLYW